MGIRRRPQPQPAQHVVIAVSTGAATAITPPTPHREEAAAMEVLATMGVAPEEAQSPVGREQAR